MKWPCLFLVVLALQATVFSLDREAFTFTKYVLDARLEPDQLRIGVRGIIKLRNDSASPQKYLCLQISSSLGWRSIQIQGNPAEFTSQIYTSDVDHTGALSEAIVTLPQEIAPRSTVELTVGYEGIIVQNAARLERIGIPRELAQRSDWDEIGKTFTAVRGVGYVTWYPVAMDAASLSDEGSVNATVERWKQRQARSNFSVTFAFISEGRLFFSGKSASPAEVPPIDDGNVRSSAFTLDPIGSSIPTFVLANYQEIELNEQGALDFFPADQDAANAYSKSMSKIDRITPVGKGAAPLRVLEIPYPNGAAFVTGGMLLTPLKSPVTRESELTLVYAAARAGIASPRAWIEEGLSHHAQVLYIEQHQGREAALNYLEEHRAVLLDSEKSATGKVPGAPGENPQAAHSLINAANDIYLQTKAMNVWWMLRDMLADINPALQAYRDSDDTEPSYMQRLLEKQTHKDLEWFFDDWVYRDRGLPDFRVDSAYPRKLLGGSYMVTVTVENLGAAGAEVPVTLRMDGGSLTRRLEVRSKSKASIRIEAASTPREVIVNDGSVPEIDATNNSYKIVLPVN